MVGGNALPDVQLCTGRTKNLRKDKYISLLANSQARNGRHNSSDLHMFKITFDNVLDFYYSIRRVDSKRHFCCRST